MGTGDCLLLPHRHLLVQFGEEVEDDVESQQDDTPMLPESVLAPTQQAESVYSAVKPEILL